MFQGEYLQFRAEFEIYHLSWEQPRQLSRYSDGLDGRGSIPRSTKWFSLFYSFQTGSGSRPAFYLVGTGGLFSGSKAARGMKLTSHFHIVQRWRMMELYFHDLIHLHGVMCN
jgi:hypothetical protein